MVAMTSKLAKDTQLTITCIEDGVQCRGGLAGEVPCKIYRKPPRQLLMLE